MIRNSRQFYFFCLFWTNVQSKRTTRAEPEDHLWSADHSLRNAGLNESAFVMLFNFTTSGPLGKLLVVTVYQKASEVGVDERMSRDGNWAGVALCCVLWLCSDS